MNYKPASFDFLPVELESIINKYKLEMEEHMKRKQIEMEMYEFTADTTTILSKKLETLPLTDHCKSYVVCEFMEIFEKFIDELIAMRQCDSIAIDLKDTSAIRTYIDENGSLDVSFEFAKDSIFFINEYNQEASFFEAIQDTFDFTYSSTEGPDFMECEGYNYSTGTDFSFTMTFAGVANDYLYQDF